MAFVWDLCPEAVSSQFNDFRRYNYVPTSSQYYLRCGEDMWFCSNLAEVRKIGHYYKKCSDMGIHFIPLGSETYDKLSETTRKTLKRIALLYDNRNLQFSGLSVAFNRITQAVSISTMRGSTTMLIARDSQL